MKTPQFVAATIVVGMVAAHPGGNRAKSQEIHAAASVAPTRVRATEAPTGFDNQTNGYLVQGPNFDSLNEDTVQALRSFNDNRFIFEETEHEADGLGPVYNAQSCRECHQNVVTGGASQVAEHRSGRRRHGRFAEAAGGSLVHSRAISPDIVEQLPYTRGINALRISTNTLGDGFVEALSDAALLAIRDDQPAEMRGTAVSVPVIEANGALRIGRFGWKSQHASLESFAADAYLNEMGITSPHLPEENSSGEKDVKPYDHVADPEDDGIDIVAFADFMRATKAPARGEITSDARAGERVFSAIGCNVCHTPTLTTAAEGTVVNGGALRIPAALANKIIHPYSDFLLHDVGTGDGIPLDEGEEFAETASKMRTAPLWGLRTRNRLMHDGLSFTPEDAIRRHGGQAAGVSARYEALDAQGKRALRAFLESL